jgi:hypothetical protein
VNSLASLATVSPVTASHGALHASLVADVVQREHAWTVEFRKQAAKFLPTVGGFLECDEEVLDSIPKVRPDAYRLDRHAPNPQGAEPGLWSKITIWEVEVTNPMPAWKADRYAWWWFDLDSTDWLVDLALIVVDKYGTCHLFDLCAHYYQNARRIYSAS